MKKRDWALILLALLLVFLAAQLDAKETCTRESCAPGPDKITLQISNPYSVDIKAEIKCDWNGEKFEYHQFMTFEGQTITPIYLPRDKKTCEIWTEAEFF